MGRIAFRTGAGALVVALALFAAPVAGAKPLRTTYAPTAWGGSTAYGGLCLQSLTCPTVTNTATPGKHGFVRSHFASLLGVGATSTGVWDSKPFTYRGAQGFAARKVKLVVRRRTDDATLLSVAGSSATYSVGVVSTNTGNAVAEPIKNAKLTPRATWTKAGHKITRNSLRRGHRYQIRITSTFVNGAQVNPAATADYKRARVVAKRHVRNH
jgi:hypothetical protein